VSNAPLHPKPVIIAGDHDHVLLRRVLRVNVRDRFIARLLLVDDETRSIALIDTGATGTTVSSADHDTALHVLWARDEPNAAIVVDVLGRQPVAPGDTLAVAAGTSWAYGPGLVVCELAGRARSSSPGTAIGPTHGLESFHGYNRRTLCVITTGFSLERWKITHPLLVDRLAEDVAIVNLVEPMAMLWPGGTDLLGRGEIRLIPTGTERVTLLPDGLGYAVIIRSHPDHDTLTHGHPPNDIASITLG
jgi:hypothetical protein